MKPHKILQYALFTMLVSFVATKWEGLSFNQQFGISAALYLILGVWAFYSNDFWKMAWVIGLCLIAAFSVLCLFKAMFNHLK